MALVALLDANILYSAFLRDLFLRLDLAGAYKAKWTDQIQNEWMSNLMIARPDIKPEQLRRIRDKMDENVLDSRVTNFEHRIEIITLPDLHDRHVLAAALECGAPYIITLNLKDFPATSMGTVEAIHPDLFIEKLCVVARDCVIEASRMHLEALKKPALTKDQYILKCLALGLKQLAAFLSQNLN